MSIDQEFKVFRERRATAQHRYASGALYRHNEGVHKRINRLYKKLKLSNPLHMSSSSLSAVQLNSTGVITDISAGIAGSDEYTGRYGTKTHSVRVLVKGVIVPGSTQAGPTSCRIVIFRAQQGSTVAQTVPNMFSDSSPIADNRIEQLYCDRYYSVAPVNASQTYPTVVNLSCKLYNHRINYTGSGAGTATGSVIFVLFLSLNALGTAAPVFQAGQISHWFKP